MNPNKQTSALRLGNDHILFLSIIAVLLVIILLLGVTIARNQMPYRSAPTRARREHLQQMRKLESVYDHILMHYIDELDAQALLQAAIDGMTQYMNDPYAGYVIDDDALQLQDTVLGNYGGIGAMIRRVYLSEETSVVRISYLFEQSSALRGGLHVGDQLILIDEHAVHDLSLEEVGRLLRGKVGSTVKLLVQREDTQFEMQLRREKTDMPTVFYDMLDAQQGLAYVRITQFTPKTVKSLEQALQALRKQDLKHLIIDLRGNPGGELEAVVRATDLFVQEGLIVQIKSRVEDQNREFNATSRLALPSHIPIMVLIDTMSASAAEVMAGALQDLGRAEVFGQPSYGKTSVQAVLSLSKQPIEYFKMTVAHYYTASQRNISQEGVKPNHPIINPYALTAEQQYHYNILAATVEYQVLKQRYASLTAEQQRHTVALIASHYNLPNEFLHWQLLRYEDQASFPLQLFNINTDYMLRKVLDHALADEVAS